MDIKENYDAAMFNMHMPLPPQMPPFYPLDPFAQYVSPCYMEINGARRKNATRETTSTLKAWLNEHRKNPYPTKGEKIMLAICTKMTLTQVSTWFANARRRLKKENKMTWSPRNRCDDDDDFIDDEPLANSANDKCSSRSASVSSVQQQNQMLQLKQEQLHSNNQINRSAAGANNQTNLVESLHSNPLAPFNLPNGLSSLPNGLANGLSNTQSALAQQQIAAAAALAAASSGQLPPQLTPQLTPQQQQLLLSDPTMAFMQQHLAALHQQQQLHQQLNNMNNNHHNNLNNNNNHHNNHNNNHNSNNNNNSNSNNIKKIEEDSSEIVDIEDNSNLGSLSDSDSINPNPAANAIQQFNSLTGSNLPLLSNHHKTHHLSHQQQNQLNQSAASLLNHHSQNPSSQLNLSQLASLNPAILANAANVAAMQAVASLNSLSPMIKSTASLQTTNKPRIWSIVDIATNSTAAANLLDQQSSQLNKEIKTEKKDNSSPLHKVSSIVTTASGISITSPSTTSIPTTLTNTTSSIKKE